MRFPRGFAHVAGTVLAALLLAGCEKKGDASLICLVTDYGSNGAAIAQLKGSIYGVNAQARVIDLLHDAGGSDTKQTAYLVDQATANFVAGTIVVVAVDASSRDVPILVRTRSKKYYVAPDDGVLSFVLAREGLEKAWQLDKEQFYRDGSRNNGAYPASDVAGPIAARLSHGAKPEVLGTETKSIKMFSISAPTTAGQNVTGEILYVNAAGDLVTNIPLKLAPWLKDGNLLRFTFGKQKFSAPVVASTTELNDLKPGKYAALYNPEGRLEIVVVKGSAARIFGASVGQTFLVQP
jgi:hypothetical protein